MTATESARRLTPDQIAEAVAGYEGMCWWVAKRYGRGLNGHDLEDLAAIARAQFLYAANRFDPGRGVLLGTFAMRLVRVNVRRAANALRRGGVHVPGYLDLCTEVPRPITGGGGADDDDDGPDLLRLVPAREYEPVPSERLPPPPAFWAAVGRHLGDRELRVLRWRYVDGLLLDECGERLGLTRERVRQIQRAAVERLRAVPEVAGLWADLVGGDR